MVGKGFNGGEEGVSEKLGWMASAFLRTNNREHFLAPKFECFGRNHNNESFEKLNAIGVHSQDGKGL